MYEHGVVCLRITTAGFHWLPCFTLTTSLGFSGASGLDCLSWYTWDRCCCLTKLSLTLIEVSVSKTVGIMGRRDRSLRPINSWAGELSRPVMGVFLNSSKANSGSQWFSLAFLNKLLIVRTLRSAKSLDRGKWGLEVIKLNCYSFAKSLKYLLLKGTLSDIIVVGIPCLAKIPFITSTVVSADLLSTLTTSGYLEK